MRRFALTSVLILVGSLAHAQTDVIVGDLQDLASYGNVGDIYAYSVGTTSCNIGTEELLWIADTVATDNANSTTFATNAHHAHELDEY